MSALAFWLLMLLLVLFVAMLVLVGVAVGKLMRRIHRMAMEVQGISSDITDIVRSAERG